MSAADIPASLPVDTGIPLPVGAADLSAHGVHRLPDIVPAAMYPSGIAQLSSG
jgi:hypothetical protein